MQWGGEGTSRHIWRLYVGTEARVSQGGFWDF